jgi:hypothetical protein
MKMLLFGCFLMLATTVARCTQLDGKWWRNADADLRAGAVDGTLDCLTWEKGQNLPAHTLDRFKEIVAEAYKKGSLDVPVEKILRSIRTGPAKPQPGGEDYSREKHGIFDGDYWGSANTRQQRGFLIGYLACRNRHYAIPSDAVLSSEHKRIMDWYSRKGADLDTKIADLLPRRSTTLGKN